MADLTAWSAPFEDVSPPCPWCGDGLTDTPSMDLPVNNTGIVECGGCSQPVEVEGWTSITWKVRKSSHG